METHSEKVDSTFPKGTSKYRISLLALLLCGLVYALTVKLQSNGANNIPFQNQKGALIQPSNSHTTDTGLKTKAVEIGETSNAQNWNRYSYGTARSDSKSLVSYTDKTLLQISKMVRTKFRVVPGFTSVRQSNLVSSTRTRLMLMNFLTGPRSDDVTCFGRILLIRSQQ